MARHVYTLGDVHLRNDDSYGTYDANGLNSFLKHRYDAVCSVIAEAKENGGHLIIAGDLLDGRSADAHTLYYASLLMSKFAELERVVLIRGNHDTDNLQGTISTLSHWKHLMPDNVDIVTYPKIIKCDGIEYHCIPAAEDYEHYLADAVAKFATEKSDAIKILIAHGPIKHAVYDNDTESKRGVDPALIKKLENHYDYMVFGDFHRHQMISDSGWYTGSVIQASLRDVGSDKCYQHIDTQESEIELIEYGIGPTFKVANISDVDSIDLQERDLHIVLKSSSKDDNLDEVKQKLLEAGVTKVMTDALEERTDRNAKTISLDKNKLGWIEDYIQVMKEQLPADEQLLIDTGKAYLEGAR